MASSRKDAGKTNARSTQRIIRIAPVTRAVRTAMAASAAALFLAGPGVAYPGTCTAWGNPSNHCVDIAAPTAQSIVVDLSRVTGAAPPSSVTSVSDADAIAQLAPGITITNSADITVVRPDDAFGLMFTSTGPITLRNSGALDITSTDALADGIFVSGSDLLVRNSGQIDASGDEWAAGIEAQGSDHAQVINRGAISATAAAGDPVYDKYGYGYVVGFTNGGTAYGVYATGGADGIVVTNTADGRISATGAHAQGIHAYDIDGTSVRVGNAGQIEASGYYASGIVAASPVEGSLVRVHNSGHIDAEGQFGATGIDALATGVGSSVHVTNSGTIDAYAASTYLGSGAGILASADGDATVGNSGVIVAGAYFGTSYGVLAASLAGTARVTNTGDITVMGGYGVLTSASNGHAVIDNRGVVTVTDGNLGLIADGGYGARVHNAGTVSISDGKYNFALQSTSSLGDVDVDNSGALVAGLDDGSDKYAFGILARARTGDTRATNRGAITTTGRFSYGVEAIADDGDVAVRNTGDIDATGTTVAIGVFGVTLGGGTTAIANTSQVAAQGIDYAAAAIGVLGRSDGGDVTLHNRGEVIATNEYGLAQGVAVQGAGDLTVANLAGGSIVATATGAGSAEYGIYGDATGIYAISAGDVRVSNAGSITATSEYRFAEDIHATGDNVTVTNSGTLLAGLDDGSGRYAFGVVALAGTGDTLAINRGAVTTTGYYSFGIEAGSDYGDVTVRNSGDFDATGTGIALGVFGVALGTTTITNTGHIAAQGIDYAAAATGVLGRSYAGDVSIRNRGDISATNAYGLARGVSAQGVRDLTVANVGGGSIVATATGIYGTAAGISASFGYSVRVDNAGDIAASSQYGFAAGVLASGYYVEVANRGDIDAVAAGSAGAPADAIGIFAYAYYTADVSNSHDITVASATGLADGIFAYSTDVTVVNSHRGMIDATGFDWAAGIEAQGDNSADVVNKGSITATATANEEGGPYGHAYGIYATGGDGGVSVANAGSGSIAAIGAYATGIRGYDGTGGAVVVDNAGHVIATDIGQGTSYQGLATGIDAIANAEGGSVAVTNSGDIVATGALGGTGIRATSVGTGASASVDNIGTIHAASSLDGKYTSAGIDIAADGDVFAVNAGSITAYSGGFGLGLSALSLAGDVLVLNSGDIVATGNALPGYGGAYSILAASENGSALAASAGSLGATNPLGIAFGITAEGATYSSATNSGDVTSDGKYSRGIFATSSLGDVVVQNSGSLHSTGKYAYGAGAVATSGDVYIVNLPGGDAYAGSQGGEFHYLGLSIGLFGRALQGDTRIDNDGGATAGGNVGLAIGIYAGADFGQADIENAGTIDASNGYGSAEGARVEAGGFALLISQGSITATATGDGVVADSNAIGAFVDAPYGLAVANNSGDITASSLSGLADGIFANGSDVHVFNAGSIAAIGQTWAAGIEAQGSAAFTYNYGTITATAAPGDPVFDPYGYGYVVGFTGGGAAYGVYSTGGENGVFVTNATGASIVAGGALATGIRAYNGTSGQTAVLNFGDVAAAGYYATGIDVLSNVGNTDVSVYNAGGIEVSGQFGASGINVLAAGAGAFGGGTVVNVGDIIVDAPGFYGAGVGIGVSADGNALIANGGSITVAGFRGPNYGAQALSLAGAASISNSGDITVEGGYGVAAFSQYGVADVYNTGLVTVTGGNFGVIAGGGNGTVVSNSGTIAIAGGMYNFAVQATSTSGDVVVDNSGTIVGGSDVYGSGYGFGLLARARQGDTFVTNSGSITTSGTYSYGIEAVADLGDVNVGNAATGVVTAYGTGGGPALGVFGVALGGGDVAIDNAGDVAATAVAYTVVAIGLDGLSVGGDVAITNSGNVYASSAYTFAIGSTDAIGISARSPSGSSAATNRGSITAIAYGLADGILVSGGDVLVRNFGQIDAAGLEGAVGIQARGSDHARVVNSDTITASAGYSYGGIGLTFGEAYGVFATGGVDGTRVTNFADGHISATASLAQGIHAFSDDGASVWVGNAGQVDATGYYASGIAAGTSAEGGLVRVDNRGGVATDGQLEVTGIGALATGPGSSVQVSNSGTIDVYAGSSFYGTTYYATSTGILASADGDATVTNAGDITAATAHGRAGGIIASGSDVLVRNRGQIDVTGGDSAIGIGAVSSEGDVRVNNAGSITTTSQYGVAKGIYATGDNVTVTNSGDITATTGTSDAYNAIGVQIGAETSASFTNTGEIHTATSTGTGIAVMIESNGSLSFTNSGVLEGAIITHAGDDAFTSTAGSTWNLVNQSTDLGAGADRVTNVAGAAIRLFDGRIDLGDGENSFRNAGLISVHGDSVIDMGGWTPRDPRRLPLFNNGTIDLVDGVGNDRLTIAGDFAGRGWIDVDMTGTGIADHLDIGGSMRPNAVQTVNVSFHGLPGVGGDTMTFARVGGDSHAGSFVAGQVFGADPGNFMNLGVDVLSRIDATNVDADTFDASVNATGLNDTGSLAASLGASVQSLMTSQIGTWRQRTGVVPDATLDQRASVYVRSFNDQGNVNASNDARNFGKSGNFAFGQANAGTQVGVGYAPGNGFNLGILLGKSNGQQHLAGTGFGRDSVLADSYGVSGTWMSPKGFYFDGSYWAMDFSARIDSAAGQQALRGKANALNLESGYSYRLSSGVNLEPQFQYTWTHVDQLLLQGPDADFQSSADAWRRTRVGLMAWKAIPGASGRLWMPYGSVSAIRLDGGDAGYSINDAFLGNLDVRGNSALVEAGIGMRKGGLSADAALNWVDGDTVDSFLGGQLVLRYSW